MFTVNKKADDNVSTTICADYDYFTNTEASAIIDGSATHSKYFYGTIISISPLDSVDSIDTSNQVIVVQPYGTTAPEDCICFTKNLMTSASSVAIKYHSDSDSLEKINMAEVNVGDKVFVSTNWYSASVMAVYE